MAPVKCGLLVTFAGATIACASTAPPSEPSPPVEIPAPDSTALEPSAPDTLIPTLDTAIAAIPPVEEPVEGLVADSAPADPPPVPLDVRVCAGGDVLLGNNLDSAWAIRASQRLGWRVSPTPDPEGLLDTLRPLVADADVILLNIEGAIGEGPASSKCGQFARNCYAFRQPTNAAAALARLGDSAVVVGNVANNHAMDAGQLGFDATLRNLGLAGVHTTGSDTLGTVAVTPRGDTVVVLGFSTAQAGPDPRNLAAVRRHVTRAASVHPRVAVTMHMGAEGTAAQRTPNESERYLGEDRGNSVAFARSAVDAGAAVVFGHGPHVMRAAEWYRGALILYSLGNLLTYGPFSLVEPLNRGGIACVSLDATGAITRAVFRSTRQDPPGMLRWDPTGRAAWLVDSLSQLDFPATAARLAGEAVIFVPALERDSTRR